MTLTQLETAARNKYNSVNDNFYSSAEIYDLVYEAELILATDALAIEAKTTTSTVAGTQAYSYPTRTIAFKRIEYEGQKLAPIDQRDDDQLTLNNSSSLEQGTPQYYFIWNEQIYLRPIPAAVGTLTFYVYKEPDIVESGDTLEVPTLFHMDIVNYVVSEMAAKDQNADIASYYNAKWEKGLAKAIQWKRRRTISDSFKFVRDEEALAYNLLGTT